MIKTARFNIAPIQPPGFRSASALGELSRLLQVSLHSLGYDCEVRPNDIRHDSVNIVLGYQLLPLDTVLSEYPVIIYQLEQWTAANQRYREHWLERLSLVREVWDFSRENIAHLQQQGVRNVRYVPIGYHPAMTTIAPRVEDVDVLFYGTMTPRRRALLHSLQRRCELGYMLDVFGARRDRALARAKIVLNIHQGEGGLLEQVRISHLLNNRRFVISESSADNPYEGMLVTAPYDQLQETCLKYLADPNLREAARIEGGQRFETMRMDRIIREALQ
jgi:hypothetical protein